MSDWKDGRRVAPRIKRKDRDHDEIKRALEQAFVSVIDIHTVGMGIGDLITGSKLPCPKCGYVLAQNLLIEIKNDEKAKFTEKEKQFKETWRGQRVVVYTRDEALRLHGVKV